MTTVRIYRHIRITARHVALLVAAIAVTMAATAAPASATPQFNLDIHHAETNFPPGGKGQYWFDVNNVGNDATSGLITLTINLPSGITRDKVINQSQGAGPVNWSCPGSAGQTTVTCTTTGLLSRHTLSRQVLLSVNVAAGASGNRFLSARVSGGGAPVAPPAAGCPAGIAACATEATAISPTPSPFGITDGTFKGDFYDADGVTPVRQAGSHPDLAVFSFDLNSITPDPADQVTKLPAGNLRNLTVNLPPGFLGDPTAVGSCEPAKLMVGACPPSSQVGRFDGRTWSGQGTPWGLSLGVFNMTHPRGVINDLAFVLFGNPVHILASLDPSRNYAIKTTVSDINETSPVFQQQLTLWGVPADPSHDSERCPAFGMSLGGDTGNLCGAEMPPKPFLTVPFDCASDAMMTLKRYDSWSQSGVFGPDVDYQLPGRFTGCEASQAEFEPSVKITPTETRADTPTGLNVEASVPFSDEVGGVSNPPVKRLQVRLPEGVTVNPSFADGLEGCSEAEIGISHEGIPDELGVTCPDQARIGAVELSTPLLSKPFEGSIYLAKQEVNPLNTLFAIYAVVHDTEERGVLVKLPGEMKLDEETGQITTTFDDLPEFPVDHLSVQFRGGDRAPLINPPTCGVKTIEGTINTWAEPTVAVPVNSSFEVTQGPDGGSCAGDTASRPFGPTLSAGTVEPIAGRFSPFVMKLTRKDGEQELTHLTAELPRGLLGKLAGVSECPDAALASISSAPGTGAAEKANPACPSNSLVGRVNVGVGAGPLPFYISGKAYLAGPYKGAPLSLAVVTPAVAGGIDLGSVVIRTALYVDPEDSHLTAVSDSIPTILHGVPVHIRDLRVVVDRPDFTLNPTNCDPLAFGGEAGGAGGSLSLAGDDSTAPLSDRFQVSGCNALGFSPSISFRLKGGTKRGDYPAFVARVKARPGDANIGSTVVALPHSEFLANEHINTVCTRVQFAAEQCPAGSIYGYARAVTPLLGEPVEGPVILRSTGTEAGADLLPNLVAVLRGKINANLVGRIDSVHGGIRTTFAAVPDVPIDEFTLSMKGGRKGLLVNSRDVCRKPGRATVRLTAQDGDVRKLRPKLRYRCHKGKKHNKGTHRRHRRNG